MVYSGLTGAWTARGRNHRQVIKPHNRQSVLGVFCGLPVCMVLFRQEYCHSAGWSIDTGVLRGFSRFYSDNHELIGVAASVIGALLWAS
ncbi:hypothetical protein [Mesorhizobium sp. B2-3-4]|uniref:hypothetical protein n=1 Tax=Mesorhizobium sp. B2-3-4 TaxID=2589959 RepID=UPI00112E9F3F|nr:hypothetical protein [Mesorhizobium sp. B2-3-4]TPM28280.1 hypothetical protein FJ967_29300 [Mesorhizobium sp. B2-3-4]